jgi:hypothetical protein
LVYEWRLIVAAKFKNVITEVDTTGSGQTLLTCPVGKTILIRTFYVRNNNSADSQHFLAVTDKSISSTSIPITFFNIDVSVSDVAVNNVPVVLESEDSFEFQTSQANQQVIMAYAELDTGVTQRYRAQALTLSSGVTSNILTCPAGSTILINYFSFFNNSGGSVNNNNVSMTKVGVQTNILDFGTLTNGAAFSVHQSFVLESGDSLTCLAQASNMTFYVSYLEIRNPPIRGQ